LVEFLLVNHSMSAQEPPKAFSHSSAFFGKRETSREFSRNRRKWSHEID
jgi:hypothetical protein